MDKYLGNNILPVEHNLIDRALRQYIYKVKEMGLDKLNELINYDIKIIEELLKKMHLK